MKDIALIVGAGDHLGSSIAKKFAENGLKVVATRRRGDLQKLITSIQKSGGEAVGIHSDLRNEAEVRELVRKIENELGEIRILIFNVGGNVLFPILKTTSRVYRKVWEMCSFGGFLISKEVAKHMMKRRSGTIIFTGATASLRGNAGYSAFSGGKQALRALAQSMARELGPEGIHIAHVIVDGVIENSSTRKLFPDAFEKRPADGIMQPDQIAESYLQLYKQEKSAWTFELDLRPYCEPW